MGDKASFLENGVFGLLMNLLETKLIFPEEYELLLNAITNPTKAIKGVESFVNKVIEKTTSDCYRSEDLYDLIGFLSVAWAQQKGGAIRQMTLSGNLAKLPFGSPGRSMARWKTRHFKLESNGLSYFNKDSDSKPKGQLILTSTTHILDSSFSGKKHSFDVVTKNGTLCIACANAHEKEVWVCGMARAIHGSKTATSGGHTLASRISFHQGTLTNYNDETQQIQTSGLSHAEVLQHAVSSESKCGTLAKLAMKSRRNWKARHFELYRKLLSYYDNMDGKRKKKKDIILDSTWKVQMGLPATVESTPPLADGFSMDACFHISSESQKTYLILCAESVSEMADWFQAFESAISMNDGQVLNDQSGMNSGFPAIDKQLEVISTVGHTETSKGVSIGMLPVTQYDTLVSIRNRIYQTFDDADIPLDFCFLLRAAKSMRANSREDRVNGESTGVLDRKLTHNYTKISKKQEEFYSIDKFMEDDGRLYIFYKDMHIHAGIQSPSLELSSVQPPAHPVPPVPPKSVLQKHNVVESKKHCDEIEVESKIDAVPPLSASSKTESPSMNSASSLSLEDALRDLKESHEEERKKWEKEIRKLRSELAQAHNMIIEMQRNGSGGGAGSSTSRILSPLESKLIGLQKDGYIEESLSCRTLQKEYKRMFVDSDISSILLDDNGAFAPLLRRFAGDPVHIRAFIEGIEKILREFTIPNTRLTQPWWKKKLADSNLLKMSKDQLEEWAKPEPWTEDTPERYAYLMGKMRPGAVTEVQMTLLHAKPEVFDDDSEDSENDEEQEPVKAIPKQLSTDGTRPARPAFLDAIAAGGGSGKGSATPARPAAPAFLQSIQALKTK